MTERIARKLAGATTILRREGQVAFTGTDKESRAWLKRERAGKDGQPRSAGKTDEELDREAETWLKEARS